MITFKRTFTVSNVELFTDILGDEQGRLVVLRVITAMIPPHYLMYSSS